MKGTGGAMQSFITVPITGPSEKRNFKNLLAAAGPGLL